MSTGNHLVEIRAQSKIIFELEVQWSYNLLMFVSYGILLKGTPVYLLVVGISLRALLSNWGVDFFG